MRGILLGLSGPFGMSYGRRPEVGALWRKSDSNRVVEVHSRLVDLELFATALATAIVLAEGFLRRPTFSAPADHLEERARSWAEPSFHGRGAELDQWQRVRMRIAHVADLRLQIRNAAAAADAVRNEGVIGTG